MRRCQNISSVLRFLRLDGVLQLDTVLCMHFILACPSIGYLHVYTKLLQFVIDIDSLCVPDIGTVLLEGYAQNKRLRTMYRNIFFDHQLDYLRGDKDRNGIIDPSARQNNIGMIAQLNSFVREIIGVYRNTVPPNEPGFVL